MAAISAIDRHATCITIRTLLISILNTISQNVNPNRVHDYNIPVSYTHLTLPTKA